MPAYIIFPDRTLIEMAEARPRTIDEMARISGVGAKKLDSFGAQFLAVIAGEVPGLHPARLKLAGSKAGTLFDLLQAAQLELARGPDGHGRYLACTQATLRQIAELRPRDLARLAQVPGMSEARTERFGAAFLALVAEA